jgi:hypothetical protein
MMLFDPTIARLAAAWSPAIVCSHSICLSGSTPYLDSRHPNSRSNSLKAPSGFCDFAATTYTTSKTWREGLRFARYSVFDPNIALENAIGSHACSLEANTNATSTMHLWWSLSLMVNTFYGLAIVKARTAPDGRTDLYSFKTRRVRCAFSDRNLHPHACSLEALACM